MPQDHPGFYFDAEKNRYCPMKGPIPGSSRNSSSASASSSLTTSRKSVPKPKLENRKENFPATSGQRVARYFNHFY